MFMLLFAWVWTSVIVLAAIAVSLESMKEPQGDLAGEDPFGFLTSDGLSSFLAVL